jgi:hypothetical protein
MGLGLFGLAARSTNAVFMIPLVLDALVSSRNVLPAMASLVCLATFGTAQWFYDVSIFGDPWWTGYHFWLPVPHAVPGLTFAIGFVPQNLLVVLKDTYIGGVIAILIAIPFLLRSPGLAPLKPAPPSFEWQSLLRYGVMVAVALFAIFLPYYYPTPRFFLSLEILGVVLIALRVAGWVANYREQMAKVLGGVLLVLVAGSLIPTSTGNLKKAAIRKNLIEELRAGDIVITGLDPVDFNYFVGRRKGLRPDQYLPISRRVEYASKLVMPRPVVIPREKVESSRDHRAAAVKAAGGLEVQPVCALEALESLKSSLAEGRRLLLDTSLLSADEERTMRENFDFSTLRPGVVGLQLRKGPI